MIDSCDPSLATWATEGNMFVIKDPKVFSETVIPKYFIHNKFSSFARQLNFYGFRKVPTKPIRNDDFDKSTAEHVLFHHPLFQKDRIDLLPEIKRHSTTPKSATSAKKIAVVDAVSETDENEQKEIQELRERVSTLKGKLYGMERDYTSRVEELNHDFLREVKAMLNALPKELLNVKTIMERTTSAIAPITTSHDLGPMPTSLKTFASSQSRIVSSDISAGNVVGI
jgi:hypothetical protein